MKELRREELLKINGGSFSAALVNAVSRAGSLLLELGRSVGSAIRRYVTNTLC